MRTKDWFERRLITNGPNREDLFDSVRLGFDVYMASILFFYLFRNEQSTSISILDVGRVYNNDLWRIKFKAGAHTFRAFYSTKTRDGFICDTGKIEVWPGYGPTYRPLSDHQLKCLIKLAGIADNEKFSKHVLARIVRAIKGIDKKPGYDTEMTEDQPVEMVKKIKAVKSIFNRNYNKTKINMVTVVSQLREILD